MLSHTRKERNKKSIGMSVKDFYSMSSSRTFTARRVGSTLSPYVPILIFIYLSL